MFLLINTFIHFSLILFLIGLWGMIVVRTNILIILMSVEIMLFSINLLFIFFSCYFDDIFGQIFALFILAIAAAESALGLAILVVYYRLKGVIDLNFVNSIKG